MTEPIAYLNGQFLPASRAMVSLYDQGFLLGVTIAEQLRTFSGRLFRLREHLERLDRSLQIVGFASGLSHAELEQIAGEVVSHNHTLLEPGDDLNLTIFVTPGVAGSADRPSAGAEVAQPRPTVCVHSRPLPFHTWAGKYAVGESLMTTDIEQVSARSWPPELKCRSRMHYFLADQRANARCPGARALMLDEDGYATEATTANVLVYRMAEGLLTPPAAKVLPGISLKVLRELAGQLSIPFAEQDLRPEAFVSADEVWLCSTSPCVLPVTHFNGRTVSNGKPGPVFERLLHAWGGLVGLDIAAQANRFSSVSAKSLSDLTTGGN